MMCLQYLATSCFSTRCDRTLHIAYRREVVLGCAIALFGFSAFAMILCN
ncbi:MAG: hypothetical protein V7K67_04495 [Nostoc sp.]